MLEEAGLRLIGGVDGGCVDKPGIKVVFGAWDAIFA